jgi:hypothetical protein
MKFNEFNKIREKAIEISGLDESANLIDYKESIPEAINTINETGETGAGSEDISDFFFGHLRSMKSLAVRRTRYPMIMAKKHSIEMKAYEKTKLIEAKAGESRDAYKENLEKPWKTKLAALPIEKRKLARETMKVAIDKKMEFFDAKVKAQVQKINAAKNADITRISDRWARVEERNKLPRQVWSHRWAASKARIDGDADVKLIEDKITIDEKYSDKEGGSIDKQIEDAQKRAKQSKTNTKAEEAAAEEAAAKEEKMQFDNLGEDAKQAIAEIKPILDVFINATSKYEAAAADVISPLKELEQVNTDYKNLKQDEKDPAILSKAKDEHKSAVDKLNTEIAEAKNKLAEAKKEANQAVGDMKGKKDMAEKAKMWDAIQSQIDEWSETQSEHKNNASRYEAAPDKEETVAADDNDDNAVTPKEKEKAQQLVDAAEQEEEKHQTDVAKPIKNDLEAAKAKDPKDENEIAELESQVENNEIQAIQLKLKTAQLKAKAKGVSKDEDETYKKIMKELVDKKEEVQARKAAAKTNTKPEKSDDKKSGDENVEQKKKETEQKRTELEGKISSGEAKIKEIGDADPDKVKKIQSNVDALKDKLSNLDKDPKESSYTETLDKLHEEMDLILSELNGMSLPKTLKFNEFLNLKK